MRVRARVCEGGVGSTYQTVTGGMLRGPGAGVGWGLAHTLQRTDRAVATGQHCACRGGGGVGGRGRSDGGDGGGAGGGGDGGRGVGGDLSGL